jgi:hypothetical protein
MADVFNRLDGLPKRTRRRSNRRPSPQAFKARKLYGPDVRWVQGPLPFSLLGQAFRLHPAAIPVLLAIKREVDIQRWRNPAEPEPEIVVTTAVCDQLGVSHDARIRAIRAMEAAGLMTATWSKGRAPKVRIAPGLFDEGKITVEVPRR